MKHLKKLLAVVLAATMVMAMGATAFAANTPVPTPAGGFTVTITPNSTDQGTHEYEAYQIFKGDLATDPDGNKILSNITWGDGITVNADFVNAIEALRNKSAAGYVKLTTSSPASDFAKAIADLNAADDDATAQAVAAAIGAALTSTTSGTGSATGVSGLQPGYYLIQDAVAPTATTGNSGAKTRYVLQVVGTVTVEEKASVPSVEKKVKDTNDSLAATAAANADDYNADGAILKDSADYDIGDAVPFQIKGTTASTAHDYTKYHVTFVDDQSAGLDAPESFSIAVLGQTLTLTNAANASATATVGKIKVTASIVTAGADFQIKVTFENTDNAGKTTGFVKLGTAVDSQAIVITYTAVLNSNANIGSLGNPNEVYLKYSNNPNLSDNSDNEEGETPKDKVIVFTYKTDIDKIDEDGYALTGADFTLYKEVVVVDGKPEDAVKGSDITFGNGVEHSAIEADKYYVVVGNKTGSATGSTFDFKGIDDGTYVFVETTVPAGYNAWKSEKVVVSAKHDAESAAPQLTELTVNENSSFTPNLTDGNIDKNDGTKHAAVSGEVYAEIENKAGAVLPATGGIGTTLFYIVGGILVIGAAVVLITRRRMDAN